MTKESLKVLDLLEKGRIDIGDALLLLAALAGRRLTGTSPEYHREDPRVNRNYARFLLQQV